MAQRYTEARKEGNRKWDAAPLDRLSLALPKGSREVIKAHAAALGESTNAFIKRAIDCQMERDGIGGPQEAAGQPAGALSPETLEAAQRAAEAAGEALPMFITRAVSETAERDKATKELAEE